MEFTVNEQKVSILRNPIIAQAATYGTNEIYGIYYAHRKYDESFNALK